MPSNAHLEPIPTTQPSPPAEDESPEPAEDPGLVIERSTSPTLVKSEDQLVNPLTEEELAELVEEGQKEIEERSGIDQPEQDLDGPLAEVSKDEEPTKLDRPTDGESEHFAGESDVPEDKPEEQPEEEEEDEATRRARITVRLANSGGFNPFAGGPPVRKSSGSSFPERRTSVETPHSFKPTVDEEQEPSAQPPARDVDPLYDETELPTTGGKEEDKPFDTLERIEGDS